MSRTLANPAVEVNDIVVGIKPNSLTYKKGKGDVNVRAQSAGGNSIAAIFTEDAETKISMVKFTLLTTKDTVELIDGWLDQESTIDLSDGDFTVSFRKVRIKTEPEINTGADGETEVEFCGQPVL